MRHSLLCSLVSLTTYQEELSERPGEAPPTTTGGISRDQVGSPQVSGLGKSFPSLLSWYLPPLPSSINPGEAHSAPVGSTSRVNKADQNSTTRTLKMKLSSEPQPTEEVGHDLPV